MSGSLPCRTHAPKELLFLFYICLASLLCMETYAACSGMATMRTKNLIVTVDGPSTTFQPLRNGQPILDFFNITVHLTDLNERNREYDTVENMWFCRWSSTPDATHIQRFSLSDFDCTVSRSTSNPLPGVLLEAINVNYTHPTIANFSVTNTFYITNSSFQIIPSNNTDYVDPGMHYAWNFEYVDQCTI